MADCIETTFGVRVAVLPVVHVAGPRQAADEAVLALTTGAPGVFLISHGGGDREAELGAQEAYDAAREAGFERPWVGVNLLGTHPWRAFGWLHRRDDDFVRGLWADESGLHPPAVVDADEPVARSLAEARAAVRPWAPLFFGGVAFKHQPQPADLAAECERMAAAGVDVLTTSGPRTGKPCDPSKVAAIRAAVGDRAAVGVASGVTPENAPALVRAGASALLVATGIARDGDFHRMDPRRLAALLAAVKGASGG